MVRKKADGSRKKKYYKVIVPPTMDVGSYKTISNDSFMQNKRQMALQDYNEVRERDGLPPVKKLPKGTEFIPIN